MGHLDDTAFSACEKPAFYGGKVAKTKDFLCHAFYLEEEGLSLTCRALLMLMRSKSRRV
jgi:hypothetical protein